MLQIVKVRLVHTKNESTTDKWRYTQIIYTFEDLS